MINNEADRLAETIKAQLDTRSSFDWKKACDAVDALVSLAQDDGGLLACVTCGEPAALAKQQAPKLTPVGCGDGNTYVVSEAPRSLSEKEQRVFSSALLSSVHVVKQQAREATAEPAAVPVEDGFGMLIKRAEWQSLSPEAHCACRWDADGKRVATCERHQGWLDVIAEWVDRAREAEAKLTTPSAPQAALPAQAEPSDNKCKLTECQGQPRCKKCLRWDALNAATPSDAAIDAEACAYEKQGYPQAFAVAFKVGARWARDRAAQSPEQPAQAEPMSDAARDVLAERARQISAEGWTPQHDDEHENGEMAEAAACYASSSTIISKEAKHVPAAWPWDEEWWKPTNPRRMLVKAGALILAEIERIDRAILAEAGITQEKT